MVTILIVSSAAPITLPLKTTMGTTVTYASTTDDNNVYSTVLATSVDTTELEANRSSNETTVTASIMDNDNNISVEDTIELEANRSSNETIFTTSTLVPAIQIPVFVGILVGVTALLILLTTAIVTLLCIFLQKYRMKLASQVDEDSGYVYDYVIERGGGIIGASNPIAMKINEAYGAHRQVNSRENTNESRVFETQYEEIHCFNRV